MNLIIFGLPKSGKTTIGQKLAIRLSLSFIDTDKTIEKLYRKQFKLNYSCRQIYQTWGEKKFRTLECEAIFSLQNRSNTIISIGGGSICNAKVVHFLQGLGKFVHLQINKKTLYSRLLLDPPVFLSRLQDISYFNNFYNTRLEYIKKIPSYTISTDGKTVDNIVDILSALYANINPGYYGE